MVSAERVLGYCRVPQEATLESDPEHKPPDDWPAKGSIEVRRRRVQPVCSAWCGTPLTHSLGLFCVIEVLAVASADRYVRTCDFRGHHCHPPRRQHVKGVAHRTYHDLDSVDRHDMVCRICISGADPTQESCAKSRRFYGS